VTERRRMRVVGHRGWRGAYPENTRAGFEAAIGIGADVLECDVHMTADGELVVIHDDTVDRTTDGSGNVHEMTVAELKGLDAGSWYGPEFAGERIMTLAELTELARGRAGLAVEVKDDLRELIPLLAAALEGYPDPLVVHSFHGEFVRLYKSAHPETKTGLLVGKAGRESGDLAKSLGCDAIHPGWWALDRDIMAHYRSLGLGTLVWTAKTRDECQRIIALEPDAIGTDCPDGLLKILGRL
jgi:glycerophosphoryl diester phosphodiesterase